MIAGSRDCHGDREQGHPRAGGIKYGYLEFQVWVLSLKDELCLSVPLISVEGLLQNEAKL